MRIHSVQARGPPTCNRSHAQNVSPCKGGTQVGHCSLWTSTLNGGQLGIQRIWALAIWRWDLWVIEPKVGPHIAVQVLLPAPATVG